MNNDIHHGININHSHHSQSNDDNNHHHIDTSDDITAYVLNRVFNAINDCCNTNHLIHPHHSLDGDNSHGCGDHDVDEGDEDEDGNNTPFIHYEGRDNGNDDRDDNIRNVAIAENATGIANGDNNDDGYHDNLVGIDGYHDNLVGIAVTTDSNVINLINNDVDSNIMMNDIGDENTHSNIKHITHHNQDDHHNLNQHHHHRQQQEKHSNHDDHHNLNQHHHHRQQQEEHRNYDDLISFIPNRVEYFNSTVSPSLSSHPHDHPHDHHPHDHHHHVMSSPSSNLSSITVAYYLVTNTFRVTG
jgi:hypothetical protein